ncbi:MAG: protein arginine kinase [Defluviitaleaceae bacterium]|nr:protein arginine kinase [Defluviitaleaceae bacterium]
MKWYEQPQVDDSVIISSRVRLARNLAGYAFPSRLLATDASAAIDRMKASILDTKSSLASNLTFVSLTGMATSQLGELSERHVISPAMTASAMNNSVSRGLVYNSAENISIMLNEEDHLRIQAICAGQDLDVAYQTANEVDDIMSEGLEYAFDTEFGFLTSCPTNTGTGMRASYMLHVPLLESTGNLKIYADIITKAGFAIRGAHGEGSESMGGIYQISNQRTLGKSETETISSLKRLANQLVEKELSVREHFVKEFRHETEDAVHRAYGILTNCRKIGLNEATKLLSDIRLGKILGLITHEISSGTIYNLMTHILPHNLQKVMGPAQDARQLDVLRAEYLRNSIS